MIDDLGPIGKGASKARIVLAETETEYIVKGPSLTPEHPTVAANEWVAAKLIDRLGLPILDSRIVSLGDDLLFGSAYLPGREWYPAITRELYERCANRDRIYDVVVVDAWLINPDRHGKNLLVKHDARANRHNLVLNDHGDVLVSPRGPTSTEDLMGCLDNLPAPFVRLGFIRDNISSPELLSASLDRVETLSDADIRALVATTPDELLAPEDQEAYAEFLVQRKARLRDLFNGDRYAFPKLRGASV